MTEHTPLSDAEITELKAACERMNSDYLNMSLEIDGFGTGGYVRLACNALPRLLADLAAANERVRELQFKHDAVVEIAAQYGADCDDLRAQLAACQQRAEAAEKARDIAVEIAAQYAADRDEVRQQLATSQATVAVLVEALEDIGRQRQSCSDMGDCIAGRDARDFLASLPEATKQWREATKRLNHIADAANSLAEQLNSSVILDEETRGLLGDLNAALEPSP
jgi:chromosome segregation ATPase